MPTHRTTESEAEKGLKRISRLYTETGEPFRNYPWSTAEKPLSFLCEYKQKDLGSFQDFSQA